MFIALTANNPSAPAERHVGKQLFETFRSYGARLNGPLKL